MVFFNSTLKNTVCAINFAIWSNIEVITIPVTNYSISILERLVDLGVLRSFKLLDTQTPVRTAVIRITCYNGAPIISSLVLFTPRKQLCTISLCELKMFFVDTKYCTILLTTSCGILTVAEAIKRGVGGQLLFQIVY